MSPILVVLTSHCDSDFECSNISFNDNKSDGVDLSSNGLDHCVRKNGRNLIVFGRLYSIILGLDGLRGRGTTPLLSSFIITIIIYF